MASGVEMLLKSMGFDPDVVKKQIADMGQIIVAVNDCLIRIEQRQIAMEAALRDAGLIRGDDAAGSGERTPEGGDGRTVPRLKQ
jgi:hypothetical protein